MAVWFNCLALVWYVSGTIWMKVSIKATGCRKWRRCSEPYFTVVHSPFRIMICKSRQDLGLSARTADKGGQPCAQTREFRNVPAYECAILTSELIRRIKIGFGANKEERRNKFTFARGRKWIRGKMETVTDIPGQRRGPGKKLCFRIRERRG